MRIVIEGRPDRAARRWSLLFACVALAACLAASPGSRAQDEPGAIEQRVKAAFLYKFAGYVDWPAVSFARPDTPFTIALLGADPVADELVQAVAGRKINERPIAVKRIKPGDSLAGTHILFVGRAESVRVAQLAQEAKSRSVLVVTESEGALEHGSVINFLVADRKVRFDIALDSAEKSGLKLSSRLLAVAQQVRTGP